MPCFVQIHIRSHCEPSLFGLLLGHKACCKFKVSLSSPASFKVDFQNDFYDPSVSTIEISTARLFRLKCEVAAKKSEVESALSGSHVVPKCNLRHAVQGPGKDVMTSEPTRCEMYVDTRAFQSWYDMKRSISDHWRA